MAEPAPATPPAILAPVAAAKARAAELGHALRPFGFAKAGAQQTTCARCGAWAVADSRNFAVKGPATTDRCGGGDGDASAARPWADEVRRLRAGANLTQEEFAARAGVSGVTVSYWENGKHDALEATKRQVRERLAKTLLREAETAGSPKERASAAKPTRAARAADDAEPDWQAISAALLRYRERLSKNLDAIDKTVESIGQIMERGK